MWNGAERLRGKMRAGEFVKGFAVTLAEPALRATTLCLWTPSTPPLTGRRSAAMWRPPRVRALQHWCGCGPQNLPC